MVKRVLITGGAGFIGSHITDFFVKRGDIVTVIDNLSSGSRENINQNASFFKYSLSDKKQLKNLIKEISPQIILHLAAVSSIDKLQENPKDELTELLSGLFILTDKNLNPSLEKFVFFSSAAVYGRSKKLPIVENSTLAPVSFYGTYKLIAEFYLKNIAFENIFDLLIFRLANIYGPRQMTDGEGGAIATFLGNLKRREPLVIYGNGTKTRDFLYVSDIISALAHTLDQQINGIYNLSTQKQTSIMELASMIINLKKSKSIIIYKDEKQAEIQKSSLSNVKLSKAGWHYKVGLETGLRQMKI